MNATQMSLRIDLRRRRADALTAAVMRELREPLDIAQHAMEAIEHPDAHRLFREIADRIRTVFFDEGVEVLTDHDRAEAGLPPRGPEGWTAEELRALELKHLEILTRPLGHFVSASAQNVREMSDDETYTDRQ